MPSNDPEITDPSAVPPSKFDKQRLGSATPKFLSVHVDKGSSIQEIAAEIAKALSASDVPYFEDKDFDFPPIPYSRSSGQDATLDQGGASQGGGASQDAASEDAACVRGGSQPPSRNHGLLILLQQEGRP